MIPNCAKILMQEDPESLELKTHETSDLFGEGEHWGAILSTEIEAVYRYMLWRIWNSHKPLMVVIMLNPSIADHKENDPTVSGLITKAKALGHGGIIVVNLNAFRATSPDEMKKQIDPVGPLNDRALELAIDEDAGMLLCAWGNHGTHGRRNEEIICAMKRKRRTPFAFRISKQGQPEHPLYKKSDHMPAEWDIDGGTISS